MSFWARCKSMLAAEQAGQVAKIGLVSVNNQAANDTKLEVTKTKALATIEIRDIKRKDRVRFGRTYEGEVMVGHHADIEPKKSIRLHGWEKNRVVPHAYDITFKIGDVAVYGGYNLTYTGKIIAIGEKTVKVQEDHSKTVHAMNIASFSDWNRHFNLDEIAKRNAAWSD